MCILKSSPWLVASRYNGLNTHSIPFIYCNSGTENLCDDNIITIHRSHIPYYKNRCMTSSINNTLKQKFQIPFTMAAVQVVLRRSSVTVWGKALQVCMWDLRGRGRTQSWLDEVVCVQLFSLTLSGPDMFVTHTWILYSAQYIHLLKVSSNVLPTTKQSSCMYLSCACMHVCIKVYICIYACIYWIMFMTNRSAAGIYVITKTSSDWPTLRQQPMGTVAALVLSSSHDWHKVILVLRY